MSPKDAMELFAAGETSSIEFKRELSSKRPKDICKEIAALATNKGGRLFIGVGDDAVLFGVSDPKQLQNQIENWLSDSVEPVPKVNFSTLRIDCFDVLCVEVGQGDHPVYYMDKRPYVRVGTASVVATPAQVEALVRYSELADEMRGVIQLLQTMRIDLHPNNNIAAGIMGQGELATMNFAELKARLISELSEFFVPKADDT